MTEKRQFRGSPLSGAVDAATREYLETLKGHSVTDLYDLVLSEVEAPLLSCVLEFAGNNQSEAARMLGLSRGTLRKKMRRYRLL